MTTLAESIIEQQARCRKLLGLYIEIGQPGVFAKMMIEDALKRTDEAVMSGDVVAMIRLHEELKEFE